MSHPPILSDIKKLLPWIDKTDPIHKSYEVTASGFIHHHYGWKTQTVKTDWSEEELGEVFDIIALNYANQMRVPKRLVLQAFKRL